MSWFLRWCGFRIATGSELLVLVITLVGLSFGVQVWQSSWARARPFDKEMEPAIREWDLATGRVVGYVILGTLKWALRVFAFLLVLHGFPI